VLPSDTQVNPAHQSEKPKNVRNVNINSASILPNSKIFSDNLTTFPRVVAGIGGKVDKVRDSDPGAPIISIKVGKLKIKSALLDYGASMSILPGMLYDQYEFGPLEEIEATVVLADLTQKCPRGMVKDVMIKLGDFHYLVDFLVLDYAPVMTNEQPQVILGRPFLATANAQINCRDGTIDMTYQNRKLCFNVFSKSITYSVYSDFNSIDATNECVPPYISYVSEDTLFKNDFEYNSFKKVKLKEAIDKKEMKELVNKGNVKDNTNPKKKPSRFTDGPRKTSDHDMSELSKVRIKEESARLEAIRSRGWKWKDNNRPSEDPFGDNYWSRPP